MSSGPRPFSALLRLFLVTLIAGGAAFVLTRVLSPVTPPEAGEELTWLTREFALTPAQADRIAALHAAYEPICARHCAAIEEAREHLSHTHSPDQMATVEAELQQLVTTCHDATQAHLEAVAAAMSPAQGERYLAMIRPRLSAHQHAEPFGLR